MLLCMRTTLSLDDDVAAQLEALRRSKGRSLKELVNQALRLGLARMQGQGADRPEFRQKASSLGGCRLPNVDDVASVLELAEGDRLK